MPKTLDFESCLRIMLFEKAQKGERHMATAKLISPITKQGVQKIRVAAYCRVSSSSADQLNSYARQIESFTKLIKSHPEWELVDIFADEGISGMKASNRTEFQRMMRMCELRKIDLVLTKSVSRFGRNAQESLEYIFMYLEAKRGPLYVI